MTIELDRQFHWERVGFDNLTWDWSDPYDSQQNARGKSTTNIFEHTHISQTAHWWTLSLQQAHCTAHNCLSNPSSINPTSSPLWSLPSKLLRPDPLLRFRPFQTHILAPVNLRRLRSLTSGPLILTQPPHLSIKTLRSSAQLLNTATFGFGGAMLLCTRLALAWVA